MVRDGAPLSGVARARGGDGPVFLRGHLPVPPTLRGHGGVAENCAKKAGVKSFKSGKTFLAVGAKTKSRYQKKSVREKKENEASCMRYFTIAKTVATKRAAVEFKAGEHTNLDLWDEKKFKLTIMLTQKPEQSTSRLFCDDNIAPCLLLGSLSPWPQPEKKDISQQSLHSASFLPHQKPILEHSQNNNKNKKTTKNNLCDKT